MTFWALTLAFGVGTYIGKVFEEATVSYLQYRVSKATRAKQKAEYNQLMEKIGAGADTAVAADKNVNEEVK